jgi:hypothetical protein
MADAMCLTNNVSASHTVAMAYGAIRIGFEFTSPGSQHGCQSKSGIVDLELGKNKTVAFCPEKGSSVANWSLNCELTSESAIVAAWSADDFLKGHLSYKGNAVTSGCSDVPTEQLGFGPYQCCILPSNSTPMCVADYGSKVGDRVCCFQPGPVEADDFICPQEEPYCLGYVRGHDKFGRPSGRCSSTRPVFPDFKVTGNITQESCSAWCAAAGRGFLVAGVQNGNQCLCGIAIPSDAKHLPREDCNALPCTGNSSETCGGNNALLTFGFNCPQNLAGNFIL